MDSPQPAIVPHALPITAPKPPADRVETRFLGPLAFADGYPTSETVARLYDQLDFQRATQVFLRHIPGLSMYCFRLGLARDLGVDMSSKLAIYRASSASLMLTPNSETLYAMTFLSLDIDGPTVFEAPPGILGLVNDMWMRPVEDIGPGGPDKGRGGKYLFVPPGYTGNLPETGYFVVRMRTFGGWFLLRAFTGADGDSAPAEALLRQVRIYPLLKAEAPPQMTYIDATNKPFDTIAPGDLRYFEMLADLVERDHADAQDAEVSGLLKVIGIEKGKPFSPDERWKAILTEAAQAGGFMAQAVSYAPRRPELMRKGAQWVAGLEGYPAFNDGHSILLDPLILMSWFATGCAKAMITPAPGTGSQYAWTYYDASGQWLRGEKNYRFRIPPNPPAKDFWSVVIYDNWTRSILDNGEAAASKNAYDKAIQSNADGSIDIYFGPQPPAGKTSNWIRTVPGAGWFALFRLYGPLAPWFDRSWTPEDIVAV
jgi:hypothetical protein